MWRIWRKLGWLPATVRQALGRWILGHPTERWDALADRLMLDVSLAGDKAHKLARGLAGVGDVDGLYRSLVSEWKQPGEVTLGAHEVPNILARPDDWPDLGNAEHRMMYLDSMTYLPGDILCKVDRAAMAVSLETRVPFLDHRVVELAWQMPLSMKISGGVGKRPLRRILDRYVPRELIERPKQGFGVPLADWLRGPLRDWADVLLDENRLIAEGYFHPAPIRQRWQEHLSGSRNWQHSLWAVLMFQAWLEAQR
jgi:asparagine synthase (glutamine-hydrolysing)